MHQSLPHPSCENATLIVVDDVWRASAVELFRADAPRFRLLLTTPDACIAAAVGAEEHLAELLDEERSRALLGLWAKAGCGCIISRGCITSAPGTGIPKSSS